MYILTLQIIMGCFFINPIKSVSLPNIALGKDAIQSRTHDRTTGAEKAVDGMKSDLSVNGGQCALSGSNFKTATWRVDLGDISSIDHITIYYRTDHSPWENNGFRATFLGFYVYVSNTTNRNEGHICFHDNGYFNISTIPPVLTLNCSLHGKYVIYYNERISGQPSYYSPFSEINLCEFEIYGCQQGSYGENCVSSCPVNCLSNLCELVTGNCFQCDAGYKGPRCQIECDGGTYGQGCSSTCGSCINNTQCHHITGTCVQGCGPGYQGNKCKEECPFGKYGINCQHDCSSTCNASHSCNRTTGECVGGCEAGWKGIFCEQQCDGGMYGQDCGNTCGSCINNTQCHHVNGTCLKGCGPGYKGDKCTEECPLGTYGNDCKNDCSTMCSDSNHCNRTTGECIGGCKPGWKGFFCKQECDGGTYGQACSKTCGSCINGTQCHHVNGSCLQGCGAGFQGDNCTEECTAGTYGNNCKHSCSITCNVTTRCEITTGKCVGECISGWKGFWCELQCDGGMYGQACSKTCGSCINNTQCHHINGSCLQGCGPGHLGDKCTPASTEELSNEQSNGNAAIIGGVVGTTSVFAVAIVFVFFFRRWKTRESKANESDRKKFETGIDNDGFSTLPENVETKDTVMVARPLETSSVDMYENADQVPDVYINEIKQTIEVKSRNKNSGFRKEYSLLPNGEKYPCSAAKQPGNATKNRFKTTFPYDHSRVVLKVDNAISSDYINANYIAGPVREHEYIASQGPKQHTVNDFWAMIWQENITQIVMLTGLIEGGKVKCSKYWPDLGIEKECGNMKIRLEKEMYFASHAVRSMKLFNKAANTFRSLTQYHYTSWPDHGTPEPLDLVLFHNHVMTSRASSDTSPLVVHCSAGIGRTGTYIALDALCKTGKTSGKVNVMECVKAMRTDRMNMVQTYEQYMTIYVALFEAFRAPIKALNVSDFVQKAESMHNHEPANRTVIRKEFQQLHTILPEYGPEDYKFAKENNSTNSPNTILPLDKYGLHLTPLPNCRGSFINAVYLPSCKDEKAFILTEYPSSESIVNFLRLIKDHEADYIVFMNPSDDFMKGKIPSTSEPISYPPFTLSLQSATESDVKTKKLLISRSGEAKTCVVVEPIALIDTSKPDTSTIRKLVNYALGISTVNAAIVVSKDGAERCGMFCAIYNCLQQMRIEDSVDVFTAVRQMRIRRPELCQTQEEYGFIYKTLLDHIQSESENVYCNM
uniref:protein-tyrosine-phosphatase n=1 Tax=Crassostrea virginica TaxID=6565 RepID=A0A8B8B956_CRAVI|nr:receptor-type tyrosine-protein phosphatase T-like isoform X2 [Crassostrea virginica]